MLVKYWTHNPILSTTLSYTDYTCESIYIVLESGQYSKIYFSKNKKF
jgi:hypothetical protein